MIAGRTSAVAFVTGAVADALLGDPPNACHPVRLIGAVARRVEARAPRDRGRRAYGILSTLAIPAASAIITRGAVHSVRALPGARWWAPAGALALSSAQRTLMDRALEVAVALDAGDLAGARSLLGYHLVSRATDDLTAPEVAGAAIESVAENLCDGVVGPWMAWALAGAGGAWAYRALNTLDSMWGYRTSAYVDLGYGAARLDDLANLVPARASALAICAAAALRYGSGSAALTQWRRDAGRTESPNAGHPMAAMAGALGVELVKPGHYRLGAGLRAPVAEDIRRAVVIARFAATLLAATLTAIIAAEG